MSFPHVQAKDHKLSQALSVLKLNNHDCLTLQDVRHAYKRLSLIYHPDKNSDPEASSRFVLIKSAHDYLVKHISDADARPPHGKSNMGPENIYKNDNWPHKSTRAASDSQPPASDVHLKDSAGNYVRVSAAFAETLREARERLAETRNKRKGDEATEGPHTAKKTKKNNESTPGAQGWYTYQPASRNFSQGPAYQSPFQYQQPNFTTPEFAPYQQREHSFTRPDLASSQHREYASPYADTGFNSSFQNSTQQSRAEGVAFGIPGTEGPNKTFAGSPPSHPTAPTSTTTSAAPPGPTLTKPPYTVSQILADDRLRNAFIGNSVARNKAGILERMSQLKSENRNRYPKEKEAELEFVATVFCRKVMVELAQYEAKGRDQGGGEGEGSAP